MPDNNDQKSRHFVLDGFTQTEPFKSPQQGGSNRLVPGRDRLQHGSALLGQIQSLKAVASDDLEHDPEALEDGFGLQVEFEGFSDVELAFESLARDRSGIELLNVRRDKQRTYATVFVPEGKLTHFERLITDYLEARTNKNGQPLDNKRLINTIEQIRRASLYALWTDEPNLFPKDENSRIWWETWLPVRKDRQRMVESFRAHARLVNIQVAPGQLDFPERTVLLAYASSSELQSSSFTLNSIAELRYAKETAEFFEELLPEEQSGWVDEFLSRAHYTASHGDAVYVCLLDTGVNSGHPLIAPALASPDLHSVDPAWGLDDEEGHGTSMAGLALLGDLTAILAGSEALEIGHRLESVKLLDKQGGNVGDSRHHGYLTVEAVSRPEVTAPARRRVFGMAITAKDSRDRGRPSAWSAAIDRLAADAENQGASPRLILVAAGNIVDSNAWPDCPVSNETDSIHDPGQAWNALTVGAYTDLTEITETDAEDFSVISQAGGLSPFSTTSLTWQRRWPLKPDVLFEGGNAAKDSLSAVSFPSLSLLTTHHLPDKRLFTTANATSAATALAARMAAQIMSSYPELWPETVRGLIVHSAEWTVCMRSAFLPHGQVPSKEDCHRLLRRCGYGVPDLDRALWSAGNSLTMLLQTALQPFKREQNKSPTNRDMHLHRLPWPKDVLEDLGETPVEMRVTLSYFVEPNPSARGIRSRYRYESHGLRFDVKRPLETLSQFRSRINAAAKDEEQGTEVHGNDPAWLIGKQNRHRGSIHSDTWRGTAADLASRETIGVYPALGWWRTRSALERQDSTARYALIVSIRAPEVDVDLYSSVANQVGVPIVVGI
jgi:Subtilase family